MVPRAVGFTIVWPEGVIFGSIMTYHVQFLLLVRQPLFDRAALPLTQTSWVLPSLSVGKMTLRLYGALNYRHGFSKGPSFGTGRGSGIGKSPKPFVGLGLFASKNLVPAEGWGLPAPPAATATAACGPGSGFVDVQCTTAEISSIAFAVRVHLLCTA